MKPSRQAVAAVAWYRREQWDRLLAVAEDRADLEATFEEWEANASNVIAQLRAHGEPIGRVAVDVEDLVRWCSERGLPVNGQARAEYAVVRLREMHIE